MQPECFLLTVQTLNDAFADGAHMAEIARILRELADKIESGASEGRVYDINGNRIGNWGFA